MDWVIDTDVLVRADEFDERHDHFINVMQLLGTMLRSEHVIAVDYEHKIRKEYRENLDPAGWVHKLLRKFVKGGRVVYKSGKLTNRISRKLRLMNFDTDDDVFVAVAYRSSSRRLVAEESDYTDSIIDYLESEGVRIIDCKVALAET